MKYRLYPLLSLCLLLIGCATPSRDIVFQTSTIDALLAGVYDGNVSCRTLREHGDFGIGTFDSLDGEMIVLDGRFYQVKSDGKVYTPAPQLNTPFATVCHFRPEQSFAVPGKADFNALRQLIDKVAPNRNLFCAIRLSGQFAHMRTRSVPAQSRPYPALAEVTRDQPEFEMLNVSGTIVGFRCPGYVKGINVPGYHLHFISEDRTKGGHILAFETTEATGSVDVLNQYFLTLPMDAKDFAATDLSRDRSKELRDVEE